MGRPMEGGSSNCRPVQGDASGMNMDAAASGDWRAQLQPEARGRIVNKIMDTLQRHLPIYGQEGLGELRNIARRFEEEIFTAATNQSDYLRKISLKMLTMETEAQNTGVTNQMPFNPTNQNPPDTGRDRVEKKKRRGIKGRKVGDHGEKKERKEWEKHQPVDLTRTAT